MELCKSGQKRQVIAIIPARSGSKSVPNKNIQSLNGAPLMSYSIRTAQNLALVNQTIVLTDSKVYADIARHWGAGVPYIRSSKTSSDDATDLMVIAEFFDYIRLLETCDSEPPMVVWLRPTHPIRDLMFIEEAINKYNDGQFCLLRSISRAKQTPYKMWKLSENDALERVAGTIEDGFHDQPRQNLPEVYWQDGVVDIFTDCVLSDKRCVAHKTKIGGIVSKDKSLYEFDIDYPEDLLKVETEIFTKEVHPLKQVKLGVRNLGNECGERHSS